MMKPRDRRMTQRWWNTNLLTANVLSACFQQTVIEQHMLFIWHCGAHKLHFPWSSGVEWWQHNTTCMKSVISTSNPRTSHLNITHPWFHLATSKEGKGRNKFLFFLFFEVWLNSTYFTTSHTLYTPYKRANLMINQFFLVYRTDLQAQHNTHLINLLLHWFAFQISWVSKQIFLNI